MKGLSQLSDCLFVVSFVHKFLGWSLDGLDALDVLGLLMRQKLFTENEHLHEVLTEVKHVVAALDQPVIVVE